MSIKSKLYNFIRENQIFTLLVIPTFMTASYILVLINPFDFIRYIDHQLLADYTPIAMVAIDELKAKTAVMSFLVFYYTILATLSLLFLYYFAIYYSLFIKRADKREELLSEMCSRMTNNNHFVLCLAYTVFTLLGLWTYKTSIRTHEIAILYISLGVTGSVALCITFLSLNIIYLCLIIKNLFTNQ